MSRGPVVQYRMPGYMGKRSSLFLEQLKADGEDPEVIKNLEKNLGLFESLCIVEDYHSAIGAFPQPVPEKYHEFLKGLVEHVQATAAAERFETLHWLACSADFKTAAKAMRMLGDFDDER